MKFALFTVVLLVGGCNISESQVGPPTLPRPEPPRLQDKSIVDLDTKDKPKATIRDELQIQGNWKLVGAYGCWDVFDRNATWLREWDDRLGPNQRALPKNLQAVFLGNTLVQAPKLAFMTTPSSSVDIGGTGTFRLDATKKPRRIDWIFPNENRVDIRHGIYDLKGDDLTLCWSIHYPRRPDTFGEGVLLKFKRTKAKS